MTMPALSMQQITWSDLCNAGFWRLLTPQLCIGGAQYDAGTLPRQSYERLAQRISKDGYFGDSDQEIGSLAPLVGEAVKRCVAVGLPAVFAWVYDEPWACYARLRPVFAHFLGAEFKPLTESISTKGKDVLSLRTIPVSFNTNVKSLASTITAPSALPSQVRLLGEPD